MMFQFLCLLREYLFIGLSLFLLQTVHVKLLLPKKNPATVSAVAGFKKPFFRAIASSFLKREHVHPAIGTQFQFWILTILIMATP